MTMPKSHLGSASSNKGIVTRSLAILNQGIVDDQQVTVPCTIKLDKLSQSTEKLQLKDGTWYYTLVREGKQRYKIEDIRILRKKNRFLPGYLKRSSARMNRPHHSDQRLGRYPPPRGSGIKRPLHSPPDDYSKHHRYESKYNRGGFGSRGSWQRGYNFSHRDDRGNYRNTPDNRYGNKHSYSPDGYHRNEKPEGSYMDREYKHFRHKRSANSKKPSTLHNIPSGESDGVERTERKNGEMRVKPLASTYKNSSQETHSNDTGAFNSTGNPHSDLVTDQSKNSLSEQDDVLTVKKRRTLDSSDSNKEVNTPTDQRRTELQTIRSETKTDTEQIDVEMASKSRTSQEKLEQDEASVESPESTKGKDKSIHSSIQSDPSETMENYLSNSASNEGSELKLPTNSDVEGVKQNAPGSSVKVHSARKSAPSSALSRTQRKKMLSRQKLLMSQQSTKDATGSPKSVSDSGQSDSDEKEGQKTNQDEQSSGRSSPSESTEIKSYKALTPPTSPIVTTSPVMVDQEERSLQQSEGAEAVSELNEKQSPAAEDGLSPEADSSRAIDDSNQTETYSEKHDTEKVPGVKMKGTALQKIKDNLMKNLKKNKSLCSPQKEHQRVGEASSASVSSRSPEPQTIDTFKETTSVASVTCMSRSESENSLSLVSSFEEKVIESNSSSHQNGAKCETDHGEDTDKSALSNVVSNMISKDMLETEIVQDDISTSNKQDLPDQISRKVKNGHFSEAAQPIELESNDHTLAEINGSIDSSVKCSDKVTVLTKSDSTETKGAEASGTDETDLDDISVDLGPEEPDDMSAIDDDILFEDQPAGSHVDSEDLDISITHIDSLSTDATSTKTKGSISKRTLSSGEDKGDDGPVSKKCRAESDVVGVWADEEPIQEGADMGDSIQAAPKQPEVIDLDEEDVTSKPQERHVDTDGKIVFTQQEWKELQHSIIDKYKNLIDTFQQKTKEVTDEQAQWKDRYSALKKDYAELKDKYVRLDHVVKQNTVTPKRTVDVQTETMTFSSTRMKKRIARLSSRVKSNQGTTEGSGQSNDSSGPASTSTSEQQPDAAVPDSKTSNLESKRQNLQAVLSKALQIKKTSRASSEVSSVPGSPSPSPSIEMPRPKQLPSSTSEVPSGTDSVPASSNAMDTSNSNADLGNATKLDKEDGPETEGDAVTVVPPETKEPNAASTASGKQNTAASQEPCSNASKAPLSSTDTSQATTLSSTNPQSCSSVPKSPSKNEVSKTTLPADVTESDVSKESSAVSTKPSSVCSSPSPSRKPKDSLAEPSKGADSSSGKSSKQSEPEIIDLTDDPDPPVVATTAAAKNSPQKPATTLPSNKHSNLTTRSPHTLVLPPAPNSSLKSMTRVATSSPQTNRVVSSVSQETVSRPGQGQPSTVRGSPSSLAPTATASPGNKHFSRPSPSASSSHQIINVNPSITTSQGQGTNVRSQIVGLQHGQVQHVGQNNQVTISQGNSSQAFSVAQQTVPASLPASTVANVHAIPKQQGSVRPMTLQQQQQISLQMLQQQRQGIHQLPGAAATAAALASSRQSQAMWLKQPSQQGSSGSAPQVQIVQNGKQQIALTPAQVQILNAAGTTITTISPPQTTALQARPQQTPQQQFQSVPRGSTQEQIKAQERAHALSQMQAKENAMRQQREQETLQAARQAAARLQSNQVLQQEAQQAKFRKLQEEKIEQQKRAQQSQGRARMLREHLSKCQEYQRALKSKLKSLNHQGVEVQDLQKQLREVQEQDKRFSKELAVEEERNRACNQQIAMVEQQLRMGSTPGLPSREQQPQQLNQLQVQQQQLQQRNRLIQQNQAQQLQQREKLKHPAGLPDLFKLPEVPSSSMFTPVPLKPVLEIRHSPEGIVLSWKSDPTETGKIEVKKYLLYAYQESESTTPSTDLWKKIGAVEALPLPMACTLTHFKAGSMYHFAVCAISKHARPGKFSNIGSINLP